MTTALVTVGKRLPDWISTGVGEYTRRLPPEFRLKIIEVSAAKRTRSRTLDTILADEGERIRAAIAKASYVIVLDEHGKPFSTLDLSVKMKDWQQTGQSVAFIIGGADGIETALKHSADEILALSALTLPHSLARLLFVEQYYRAWSILNNHPYHRE